MIDLLIENKDWIFSGIGVAAAMYGVRRLMRLFIVKEVKESEKNITIVRGNKNIYTGRNNINIDINGGDFRIEEGDK